MERRCHWMCVACNPPQFCLDADDLNHHLRTLHPHLSKYQCGRCKSSFLHKTSLIRHIQQYHESTDDSESCSDDPGLSASVPLPLPTTGGASAAPGSRRSSASENTEDIFVDIDEETPPKTEVPFDMKAEAALFLMRLRSSGNITHTSVQLIQSYVEKLLESVIQHDGTELEKFLEKKGLAPEASAEYLTSRMNSMKSPFEGMETLEEQLDYFSEKYGMVVPEEKHLGSRIENRFDREKRRFLPKQVIETFQYVSVIKTLKLLVQSAYIRELILSEKASDDGVYRSYRDGTDFKTNPFLKKFPYALRILMYLDDLEIANALGSKDVIHKLGNFYFSILNLPAEESSQLASVFLFAMTYAEDLKREGVYAKVLKPFRDEIKQLMSEDGVLVDLPDGGTFTLRACVVALSADSLAAHSILGMMSPSSKFFCRLCLATLDDLRRNSAYMGQLRTSRLQAQHVNRVKTNPLFSKQCGVKEESALIDIMRVPEDSALDLFHDFVGVIQMIIKVALYEYICVRKLFSVYELNANINMFVYGTPDVQNKPSPNFMYQRLMDNGHSLKQNGSQTFCLLRIFPFVISGVDVGDPFLEMVHLLQDIVRIAFAYAISESDILNMENLVDDLQKLFHQTCVTPDGHVGEPCEESGAADDLEEENEENVDDPDGDEGSEQEHHNENEQNVSCNVGRRRPKSKKFKKPINKFHHIKHVGQQIREKGPLIRLWCAKFEGRHRIVRKHSAVQCNFKNPPKTMSKVMQLSTFEALLTMIQAPRMDRGFLYSETTSCTVGRSPYSILLLLEGLQESDIIKLAKSVEVSGIEYSTGLFIALKALPPAFGLITDIVIVEKKETKCPQVFLVVVQCHSQVVHAKYNAYPVANNFDEPAALLDISKLIHHLPIAPWSPVNTADDELYLYPRTIYV